MPASDDDFVRFVETGSLSARTDLQPQNSPRPNPMSAIESPAVSSYSSAAPIHLFFPGVNEQPRLIEKTPFRGAKFATVIISSSAFVAWFLLMLTVVAVDGSLFEIAVISMIPFLAHVASVCLTAFSAPHDFGEVDASPVSGSPT